MPDASFLQGCQTFSKEKPENVKKTLKLISTN